jgi:hypothetical protein
MSAPLQVILDSLAVGYSEQNLIRNGLKTATERRLSVSSGNLTLKRRTLVAET